MQSNLAIAQHGDQFDAGLFDNLKRFDEKGTEYWSARELMATLGYVKWQMFKNVIDIAKENLETIVESTSNHFLLLEVKSLGRNAIDYKLTRLACYHIALACDSRGKEAVKLAKHYFVVKTREAEVIIPAQSERLRELELELQLIKAKADIATMHGKEYALVALGNRDQIVEIETKVTEVVNPDTGSAVKILTADQLKTIVRDRTGQKLVSLKWFTDQLRDLGRDDLLIPVNRSHVTEYPIPDKLNEAIALVYRSNRQKLIGE